MKQIRFILYAAFAACSFLLNGCGTTNALVGERKITTINEDLYKLSVLRLSMFKEDSTYQGATGFIIRGEKGCYVITNYSAVRNVNHIQFFIKDDREHLGHSLVLFSYDTVEDIALLKLDPADSLFNQSHKIKPLTLGDSDELFKYLKRENQNRLKMVGYSQGIWTEDYLNVKNPLVSGNWLGLWQTNVVVTDARVNEGSWGSPILNEKDEVLAFHFGYAGKYNRLSAAIPINDFKKILPRLENGGYITYPATGIGYIDSWFVEKKFYEMANIPFPAKPGVIILDIEFLSPAYLGGLHRGDIIVECNGKPIRTYLDFLYLLRFELRPNQMVKFKILRDGQYLEKDILLGLSEP